MATTIRVSPEVRDALMKLGSKGETYDDIISRLIEVNRAANSEAIAR